MYLNEESFVPNESFVRPLKPSEAIRIGVKLRPKQCRGLYFQGSDHSCALGAMLNGYGLGNEITRTEMHKEIHPLLTEQITGHIIFLNDIMGKSREEIADWLERKGL